MFISAPFLSLPSLLRHCSGAHRPLVLQEVWISGESSSRGESRDHSSFTTSEKTCGLTGLLSKRTIVIKRVPPLAQTYGAPVRLAPICRDVKWHGKKTELMQAERRFCWLARLLVLFTYLKGFSQNLLPSFGLCLFATFTSVYYAAPAIVPHQMDLIQIVKMSD